MTSDDRVELPESLSEIAEDFASMTARERLELLERVNECQTPLFLVVEVGDRGPVLERMVSLFLQAPGEAPTTRGFAGILREELDGLTAAEVLAVPDDAPYRFGLGEAVSPLCLRGMVAMLSRIKRQVRLKTAA